MCAGPGLGLGFLIGYMITGSTMNYIGLPAWMGFTMAVIEIAAITYLICFGRQQYKIDKAKKKAREESMRKWEEDLKARGLWEETEDRIIIHSEPQRRHA